MSGQPIKPFGR